MEHHRATGDLKGADLAGEHSGVASTNNVVTVSHGGESSTEVRELTVVTWGTSGSIMSSGGHAIVPRVSLVVMNVPVVGGRVEHIVLLASNVNNHLSSSYINVTPEIGVELVELATKGGTSVGSVETDGAARRTSTSSAVDNDGTTSDGIGRNGGERLRGVAVGTRRDIRWSSSLRDVAEHVGQFTNGVSSGVEVGSSSGGVSVGVQVIVVDMPSEISSGQSRSREPPVDAIGVHPVDDSRDSGETIGSSRVVDFAGKILDASEGNSDESECYDERTH